MKTLMLRPGLLVSLKTTVRGGVQYEKLTIEPEHVVTGEATEARWETTRKVRNAEELKRATVARGKARNAIIRACCPSSFGLLCPVVNEEKLDEGIAEALEIVEQHNKLAIHTRVDVYVVTGRVADNDEMAARAIGSEVRDLIGAMDSAVRAASPDAIREAANKARAIAGMLGEDTQKKVTAAIAEVRKVAREIVSRVNEAGETAASVVQGIKLEALTNARFAVLDMLGEKDVPPEVAPESVAVAGRAVDLEPESSAPEQQSVTPADDKPEPPDGAAFDAAYAQVVAQGQLDQPPAPSFEM